MNQCYLSNNIGLKNAILLLKEIVITLKFQTNTIQRLMSTISRVMSEKGLFPTLPSSISLKIGIVRDFSKKQRSVFYLGQKASNKKTTGLPTFRFSTISPSYFL
jgi:hypothetical protein